MFSFFQKNKATQGKETATDSKQDIFQKLPNLKENIKTGLFIPASYNISKEELYILQFLNNELGTMEPNQLSVSGISLHETPYFIEVRAFFRNTLTMPFKVASVKLALTTSNKDIIAQHTFDLSYLGLIEPEKSIYVILHFPVETIRLKQFDPDNFSLFFDNSGEQYLDFENQKSIAAPRIKQLE